jgi:hypothetical protein
MNITLLSIARRNYCRPGIPLSTQRHNVRAWARSVHLLGSKWLLATPIHITKKGEGNA